MEIPNEERILELASNLDDDLESQDVNKVLKYFSKNCEVELFGITLNGISGIKNWLDWFFGMFNSIEFEPIVILVRGNIFFEEFFIHLTYGDKNVSLDIKIAEVLEYKNYKIKSLRLYFDRLQFSDVIADNFIEKKILNFIKKKSMEDLI
jgi:hypothetical protein